MTRLIDLKSPKSRFARSINVERDSDGSAIDGYLPVGRAIDVIKRLAASLNRDESEVALSITGPYGSGKSSLAVVIDALLGPAADTARQSAEAFLNDVDPDISASLSSARKKLGAGRSGFIRASATAAREPVVATVLRALINGVERFSPTTNQRSEHASSLSLLRRMHADFVGEQRKRPETRTVREIVVKLSQIAPVLILIDEFGKNLEAFADDANNADLFLLQELAEWTRGNNGIPLAVITLQHMAFDEYATGTSVVQRREWAKVQGRFDDIPFVDSPAQTRNLIAAAFNVPDPKLAKSINVWAKDQAETISMLGSGDLLLDVDLIAGCWPLHPISLAVLPDLCERYGQNERTLFSFLAGHEPLSVATFLSDHQWSGKQSLPVVRLDRLYDFFVESAATMVAVSSAASRWVEIDNRIRDARGIEEPALRVLKAIGLLNLISAGGTIRASRSIVCYATADGSEGTASPAEVAEQLSALEVLGLITYRDFADEFRIWQGSDFNLKAAIDQSQRRLRDVPATNILESTFALPPVVAARHSHRSGTLRAFLRHWVDPNVKVVEPLGSSDQADGTVYYVLGSNAPTAAVARRVDEKPITFLTTTNPNGVIEAARELAAIDDVLATSTDVTNDWVAHRELLERRFEARGILDREFELAYGTRVGQSDQWTYRRIGSRSKWTTASWPSASSALTQVADSWYGQAPQVRNDLINRHEVSSQMAKARRMLIEAMLSSAPQLELGIDGFGPDRTLYLSILKEFSLHRHDGEEWAFCEPLPDNTIRPAWDCLTEILKSATTTRKRVNEIHDALAAPPFGLRSGVSSILVIAALLLYSEDIALYEHGTFKPVLTDDICERLIRNPVNFEIKHFASRTGNRAELLTHIANCLQVKASRSPRNGRVSSVLAVLSHLVAVTNTLPEYSKRTGHLSRDALTIRKELFSATEPDELLFVSIPRSLGKEPIAVTGSLDKRILRGIAIRTQKAIQDLQGAYPALLADIRATLQEQLRGPDDGLRENLAARARDLKGKVIEPSLARLVVALAADIPGDDEWAEYVGMNVVGTPPGAWTDEDRGRFFGSVHDIGSTFRRIEALNADVRSRGESFDALRVTVTRSDGAEAARLVWVDEARRMLLGPIVEMALESARRHSDSATEARDLLLAMLAEGDLISDRPQLPKTQGSPSIKAKRNSQTER
jgi:hypothetical protein